MSDRLAKTGAGEGSASELDELDRIAPGGRFSEDESTAWPISRRLVVYDSGSESEGAVDASENETDSAA